MKILQVIPYFPPFPGGVEYNAYYSCRELAKLGHEITVICFNHNPGYKEERMDGMNVKRVPLDRQFLSSPFSSNLKNKVYEELKNSRYDIIHTHIPSPFPAYCAALASSRFNIPLALTYHNDIGGLGFFSGIFAFIWNMTFGNYILSKCSRIFATTPIYPELSPWLKMHGSKIAIVPNGVDLKTYNPSNSRHKKAKSIRDRYKGKKIIFFVGSMGVYKKCKGIDYLIKSAQHIKKKTKDFMIVIGGKGKLRDFYTSMAKKLNVDDVVDLIGYVKDKDMPYFYGAADLTVLPSINKWEGFGIIIMESLATKKPVVGSNIGGIPYAIGNGGLLAKPKDERDLADKILTIILNKKLADKYANNGFDRVKKLFQWKDIAKTQEKFYKEVVKETRENKK